MNNNNIFLQLREEDTENAKDQFGEFNAKLQKPIILNDGDELLLNKAIIDSRTVDSDRLILENPTTFTFKFGYYLVNNTTQDRVNPNGGAAWTTGDQDLELYVLCKPDGGGATVYELTRVVFRCSDNVGYRAPFNVNVFYTDTNGIPRTASIKVSQGEDNIGYIWDSGTSIFAISSINGFFDATDQNLLNYNGASGFKTYVDENISGSNNYQLFTSSYSFTLDKGQYDFGDFADRLNQKLTFIDNNQIITQDNITGGNPVLETTLGSKYNKAGTGLYQTGGIWVRSTDATKAFELKPPGVAGGTQDQYFGTSQVVFAFDEDTNRFYIKYLNFPLYDTTSGNQSLELQGINGSVNDFKIVNKYSGIIIDGIQCLDTVTNLNVDIFQSKLGFDLSKLIPTPTFVTNSTATGTSARFPKFELKDSVNITGALSSIDFVVSKNTNPSYPPAIGTLGKVLTDQQNEIYAAVSVGNIALNFGYYLIEITGLRNDLITQDDIKNNIMGIISRYYQSNNYTIGSPEDAVIYTHRGPSLYLNNLGVRILQSDYTLAPNLGPDNTIFLQLRKARVALDIIQMEEQKKEIKN